MIDKASLLAALQPATTTVQLDGFGPVTMRQITVAENDSIRALSKDATGSDFGLRLLAAALVDDAGAHIFDEADLAVLKQMSGSKIDALVASVLKENGYRPPADAAGNANA